MSYKDKYLKRNDAYNNSASRKEDYIKSTKSTISNMFMDNPSAKKVFLNDSEEESWVWIVEDTKMPSVKKIVMRPDEIIRSGWMINWNDEKWLCTSHDKSKDIYETGFIEKCNSTLKWIDKNGVPRSFSSVFSFNTRSNFGIKDDRIMTVPDGRRQVVVQKNEHTIKIEKNTRFIFGGIAYKVIDLDRLSDEGLVNLSLMDDYIDPALDNLEDEIANYYGKIAVYQIVSLDGNKISERAGREHQINARVLNNGREDTSQTIVYESSNEDIATVDESGLITTILNGSVTITMSLESDPSIKTTINLTVQLINPDNYTVKIIGENVITMGFDEYYTIEVRNNGVLDVSKGVNWTLLAEDGTSTTSLASFTMNQFTQCRVKGSGLGYVTLKCVLQGYSAVVATKLIQVKSIL